MFLFESYRKVNSHQLGSPQRHNAEGPLRLRRALLKAEGKKIILRPQGLYE
jgi:hypothetical protein